MTSAVLERGPVAATADERLVIAEIDRLLAEPEEDLRGRGTTAPGETAGATHSRESTAEFRLVGPEGREVVLPVVVVRLLRDLVHHLAHDRAVAIAPVDEQLTTQQAADLLHVSRPHLIALLERGEMPFIRPGSHRRLKLGDVLDYKRRRDAEAEAALDDLALMGEEMGLYR